MDVLFLASRNPPLTISAASGSGSGSDQSSAPGEQSGFLEAG